MAFLFQIQKNFADSRNNSIRNRKWLCPIGKHQSKRRKCASKLQTGSKPTDLGKVEAWIKMEPLSHDTSINVASMGMAAVVHELFTAIGAGAGAYLSEINIESFLHRILWMTLKSRWLIGNGWQSPCSSNCQRTIFWWWNFYCTRCSTRWWIILNFHRRQSATSKISGGVTANQMKRRAKDFRIRYDNCSRVSLTSSHECWIETEGELAGLLPATVTPNS